MKIVRPKKLLLGYTLGENFKEESKNSILSELPKIAMLPKKHSLGI